MDWSEFDGPLVVFSNGRVVRAAVWNLDDLDTHGEHRDTIGEEMDSHSTVSITTVTIPNMSSSQAGFQNHFSGRKDEATQISPSSFVSRHDDIQWSGMMDPAFPSI